MNFGSTPKAKVNPSLRWKRLNIRVEGRRQAQVKSIRYPFLMFWFLNNNQNACLWLLFGPIRTRGLVIPASFTNQRFSSKSFGKTWLDRTEPEEDQFKPELRHIKESTYLVVSDECFKFSMYAVINESANKDTFDDEKGPSKYLCTQASFRERYLEDQALQIHPSFCKRR